jgi:diguanylate cyclase (GGDEF)-like protein
VVAKNGEEAWQFLVEETQQHQEAANTGTRLAILDWQMPRMDGIELCRKIREKTLIKGKKYIYIILLTGRDHQEDIIQGLSAGADDYMVKPFDLEELKVRIKIGERILQVEDKKIELTSTDRLTQLWSRIKILDFLNEEWERSHRLKMPLGVILINIDSFKSFNQKHGTKVGNQILLEVASRIKNSIRIYDKIGRYYGDEFLAVFPNCRKNQIIHIGERIRRTVRNDKVETEAGSLSISLSAGGTSSEFFPKCSDKDLVEASKKALLMAKKKGRNQVIINKPEEE